MNTDTICNIYNHEQIVDSLWASIQDTSKGCYSLFLHCKDTLNRKVFNNTVPSKKFYRYRPVGNGYSSYEKIYVKKFGMFSNIQKSYGGGGSSSTDHTLISCVIKGVVYGDTSLPIGIHNLSIEDPAYFRLSQNYPNPFNPSTSIEFSIQKSSFVNITVYDVTGKEISSLVNEELKPGTYKTEWNANEYPSGIYYCTLITEKYKETKKMALIK